MPVVRVIVLVVILTYHTDCFSPSFTASKIAEKIRDNSGEACLLMVCYNFDIFILSCRSVLLVPRDAMHSMA